MSSIRSLALATARNPLAALRTGIKYLLVGAGAAFVLLPFLWMISSSLKELHEVFLFPPEFIPAAAQWSNYVTAWEQMEFPRLFVNTSIYTAVGTFANLASSSLAAYAFARIGFFGRRVLFGVFLATMMVPGQVTLIPLYLIVYRLGWVDTWYALIVPHLFGSAFGIFLLRQFFMTLPVELEDAAVIDGYGRLRIYWAIVLPLSKPALATLGTISFMALWNDFLWPLIVTTRPRLRLLTVGLAVFQDTYITYWNTLMAGTTMVMLPILVVFLFAQKFFVRGITVGALKG